MPKYMVPVTEEIEYRVPVDATDEEAAQRMAVELVEVAKDRDKWFHACRDRGAARPEELTRYECVIFKQGDDYAAFERVLYPGSDDLVLITSNAEESAALEHLKQWDYDEPTDDGDVQWDSPATGSGVRSYSADGYLMVWHTGLGWAALYRVVEGATP